MSVVVARTHVIRAHDVGFKNGRLYRIKVMRVTPQGWRESPAFTGWYVGYHAFQHVFLEQSARSSSGVGRERRIGGGMLLSVADEVLVP